MYDLLLKGGTVIPAGQEALTITRSLPHGHVAAVHARSTHTCQQVVRKSAMVPRQQVDNFS